MDNVSVNNDAILFSLGRGLPPGIEYTVTSYNFASPTRVVHGIKLRHFGISTGFCLPFLGLVAGLFKGFSICRDAIRTLRRGGLPIVFVRNRDSDFMPYRVAHGTLDTTKRGNGTVFMGSTSRKVDFLVSPRGIDHTVLDFLSGALLWGMYIGVV